MQARDFCFWLQGFYEITNHKEGLTAEQVAMIKRHLDMVFKHDIAPKANAEPEVVTSAPELNLEPLPPEKKKDLEKLLQTEARRRTSDLCGSTRLIC